MEWYKDLFLGKRAKKRVKTIIEYANDNRVQTGAYFITLAANEKNSLDIYPAGVLVQPHFRRMDLFVVGIAANQEEAKEVTVEILMECYKRTGQFLVRKMVEE